MAGAEHAAFDAGWLSLREPVDHRSRSASLIDTLVRRRPEPDSWRILDLGSGTGSNFRYIAPRIPAPQAWTLLDRDAALLEQAGSGTPPVRVRTIVGNLASEGIALVAGSHLVTASALLDLVSWRWLTRLITCCRTHDCAVLFSLTYDGEICWHASPGSRPAGSTPGEQTGGAPDPLDALVREAVNEHQRREKGLGPALGPGAGHATVELLHAAGYETRTAPSPWRLGPGGDAPLARRLVRGWQAAAAEMRPGEKQALWHWAERKFRLIEEGSFEVCVGHQDVLGLP